MSIPNDEIVVLDIAGNTAIVACGSLEAISVLTQLGFKPEGNRLKRSIPNSADREQLVVDLIRLRALFSTGRDWSPAELVELYREQGIVTTNYRQISWAKPDQYVICDR